MRLEPASGPGESACGDDGNIAWFPSNDGRASAERLAWTEVLRKAWAELNLDVPRVLHEALGHGGDPHCFRRADRRDCAAVLVLGAQWARDPPSWAGYSDSVILVGLVVAHRGFESLSRFATYLCGFFGFPKCDGHEMVTEYSPCEKRPAPSRAWIRVKLSQSHCRFISL
jgi:hypothetical protein